MCVVIYRDKESCSMAPLLMVFLFDSWLFVQGVRSSESFIQQEKNLCKQLLILPFKNWQTSFKNISKKKTICKFRNGFWHFRYMGNWSRGIIKWKKKIIFKWNTNSPQVITKYLCIITFITKQNKTRKSYNYSAKILTL